MRLRLARAYIRARICVCVLPFVHDWKWFCVLALLVFDLLAFSPNIRDVNPYHSWSQWDQTMQELKLEDEDEINIFQVSFCPYVSSGRRIFFFVFL